jgi:hypothetical protein
LSLSVQCDCGARLAEQLAPELENTLPLPVATDGGDEARAIDAAAFIAWQARADATLTDTGRPVATVYRVWLHRTDAPGRTGRAVYFEAAGEHYAVFASLTPTLLARKLPEGWLHEKLLPAQKQAMGYAQTVIPRFERQLPGVSLLPTDDDGSIALSAGRFEDLFRDSDVELERLPFATVFGRELQALAGAAAHAATCGRPLHLRHV